VAHASAGVTAAHGAGTSRAGRLELRSNSALVIDEGEGRTLFEKNPERIAPIASITKLMTAMVTLDAALPSDEIITIERSDVDGRKHTASRLKVGDRLSRGDLLWVALMASENRAAAALARNYPGGAGECVSAMNRKAQELGMLHTRFEDPTGLSSQNVSTAQELTLLVRSAYQYPAIRESTTSTSHTVAIGRGRTLEYHNSNGLVKNRTWDIELSKTGYINEAGRCLVMRAEIAARPVIIVLLDSWGKYTRLGDANRIRKWMESTLPRLPGAA
jgi:D-alanyl-D-alanine endopeptidase (penicillin-binding protein 7)